MKLEVGGIRINKKTLILHVFLLLLLAEILPSCLAEEPAIPVFGDWQEEDLALTGLSSEQIKNQFGPPDKVQLSEKTGVETWHYGNSILFIDQDQVAGWTSTDDLRKRYNVNRLKVDSEDLEESVDEDYRKRGWLNPWTPEPPPNPGKVLSDILSNE